MARETKPSLPLLPSLPGADEIPSEVEETQVDAAEVDEAPEEAEVAPVKAKKTISVVATDFGFYGQQRLKEGDHFEIADMEAFSSRWMKLVKPAEEKAVVATKKKKAGK